MSFRADLQIKQQQATARRIQMQRMLARYGRAWRISKDLFIGSDGDLTDNAAAFFALLADEAGMNKRHAFNPDRDAEIYRAGQERMVHFIIDMMQLSGAQIEQLQRKLGALTK